MPCVFILLVCILPVESKESIEKIEFTIGLSSSSSSWLSLSFKVYVTDCSVEESLPCSLLVPLIQTMISVGSAWEANDLTKETEHKYWMYAIEENGWLPDIGWGIKRIRFILSWGVPRRDIHRMLCNFRATIRHFLGSPCNAELTRWSMFKDGGCKHVYKVMCSIASTSKVMFNDICYANATWGVRFVN